MFVFILMNKQWNHTGYVTIDALRQAGCIWALRKELTSLCQFHHVTVTNWYLREFCRNTCPLIEIIYSLTICEEECFACKWRESSRHGQRVRGRVLYYADNAMLTNTEQCPEICVALTGSRRVRVKIIILVIVYFFWVFCFWIKSTQRGGWMWEWQWGMNRNEGDEDLE